MKPNTRNVVESAGVTVLMLTLALSAAAQQPLNERDRPPPAGAAVPEGVRVERDLEYAMVRDKRLLLDLYLPEKADLPLPVIVGIHGGGWANGSKAGGQGAWLARHGYAVAVINYRLSGEAVFPAQIEDCKAAVRWLRANAKKFNLNPDRFGATGHSAGGHLASLLATTANVKGFDKGNNLEFSSRIQAAAPSAGPTDFLQMDAHAPKEARLKHDAPQSPEARLIGGPIQENKDTVAKANPITYVTKDDPPFLIIHGDQDPVVPAHQAQLLHEALKKSGVEVNLHLVQGAGHGVGGREVSQQIVAFFDMHLKDGPPGPLPGQIVIDPEHPQWLMRHGGKHVFICGPGDPEEFLYAGKRNPDGTRDGDQVPRIDKLIAHGGNCIYLQLVRSHGGDAKGDQTQNPFVDSNPAKGLDEGILEQWEEWFTLMDRHEILIYLFFYDDSARIWNTGDRVGPEEKAFLEVIVKKFKHHKNLIWIVGEESEERYSTARVQEIAQVIKNADEHGHLIGTHHHSGTTFKAWRAGGALNHFAMQLAETDDAAHAGAIDAVQKADGRYQIIYSESTAMRTDVAGMRRHAWEVAMGGLMPMLLRMDIAGTPLESLQQCRTLQTFFESTDFWTMAPHDELKHAQTKYVLADPGRSYIAYADDLTGKLGVKDLLAGKYEITWIDCRSGQTKALEQVVGKSGDHVFEKPQEFGNECAAWIRRQEK